MWRFDRNRHPYVCSETGEKSEQKSEKVEQELQTKLEEKQKNPKQETPETQESKDQQKTEEELLSMELSGLNEDALSMMGISKKEVADALRTWTQEHGFSKCNRSTVFGTDAGTIFREKYSMDCQLIFADGGNGIQPEDVQTKLTMDYFKEKKLLQIHK